MRQVQARPALRQDEQGCRHPRAPALGRVRSRLACPRPGAALTWPRGAVDERVCLRRTGRVGCRVTRARALTRQWEGADKGAGAAGLGGCASSRPTPRWALQRAARWMPSMPCARTHTCAGCRACACAALPARHVIALGLKVLLPCACQCLGPRARLPPQMVSRSPSALIALAAALSAGLLLLLSL
jgi:hypothetical protein